MPEKNLMLKTDTEAELAESLINVTLGQLREVKPTERANLLRELMVRAELALDVAMGDRKMIEIFEDYAKE